MSAERATYRTIFSAQPTWTQTGGQLLPKRPKKGTDSAPLPSHSFYPARVDSLQPTGKQPSKKRGSALINIPSSSALAKRIAYSKFTLSKLVGSQATATKKQSGPEDDKDPASAKIGQFSLPPLADTSSTSSAFAKRRAYSAVPKGRQDPLSQKMRDYFTNTSMIDTWLMHRIARNVKEAVDKKSSASRSHSSPESSPCRSIATLDRSSALAKRQGYRKGSSDPLEQTTRDYFTNTSQVQTWCKQRIVKAIYTEIERKYKYESSCVDIRPTRRFISALLFFIPPRELTFEGLFQEVEVRWIQPRLMNYRRMQLSAASYMLSGIV